MALAGDEVLDLGDRPPGVGGADPDIAEMEPEFARLGARQRHRDRDRIVAADRLLHVADDGVVIDLGKLQIAGLQQRRVRLCECD